MSDVKLLVNGEAFGGWQAVRITRSIESIAGSFDLGVTDKWGGQEKPYPIGEEDACEVTIDDETVIDGYIDGCSIALSAEVRSLSFRGKDRAAVLVECSAILDRWSFRNATAKDIAEKVCEPFGIRVSVQPGLILPPPREKLVVNPGDTAFSVITRAAQEAGVLVVSDGAGGVLFTRAGIEIAEPLVEGGNVLAAAAEYDATQRFSQYVVATQTAGSDNASGGATRIRATAEDEGVRRADRVLMVLPEAGISTAYARQRADWEARVRAANAQVVTIMVRKWQQSSGQLWPVNAPCSVQVPSVRAVGQMRISQVEHILDERGEVTQIRLVRPDAFTPEPQEAKVKRGGGLWTELRTGAL